MPEPTAPPLERVLSRPEQGTRSIADIALGRDPARPRATNSLRQPSLKGGLTHRLTNCPVPVPRSEWEAVLTGAKRMYRSYSDSWHSRFLPIMALDEQLPRPAVIYSRRHDLHSHVDSALAVILSYRQEPLGAISEADLRAEGFIRGDTPLERNAGMRRFRRRWRIRYKCWGWRPQDMISVVELRPWTPDDHEWASAWLFQRLYGDWA